MLNIKEDGWMDGRMDAAVHILPGLTAPQHYF